MGANLYVDHAPKMTPPDPEPWMADASCAEVDPDLFFAESSGAARLKQDRMAKGVCAECPVRLQCLAYTLKNEAITSRRYGIAGGMTPMERSSMERALEMRRKNGQEH